jgi:hypothetical protein
MSREKYQFQVLTKLKRQQMEQLKKDANSYHLPLGAYVRMKLFTDEEKLYKK